MEEDDVCAGVVLCVMVERKEVSSGGKEDGADLNVYIGCQGQRTSAVALPGPGRSQLVQPGVNLRGPTQLSSTGHALATLWPRSGHNHNLSTARHLR